MQCVRHRTDGRSAFRDPCRHSNEETVMHSPLWPGILVTLAIVVLLMSFQQVVSGAVQQGESRRIAAALRADAAWRCNTMRGSRLRDDCVARLDAGALDSIGSRFPS
jgi:hypothetical protein